ncbi:ion channel [Leifsonia sp. A12D58]|uniref:ion channel n=1 Tax=Leifsonia sp. A12D58 TaxID=3397674 RepID=UPI0039DFAD2C
MATRETGGAAHSTASSSSKRRFTITDTGYLVVFILLVVSYIVSALQESVQASPLALVLQLVSVVVIFRVARVNVIAIRVVDVIIVISLILVIAAWWVSWAAEFDRQWLDILLSAASAVFYLVTPVVIIQDQLRRKTVDIQTLIASISAYLLIAMFFTFLFNLISLIEPGRTFGEPKPESLSAQLFYSFTTITTIGKSALGPVTALGQSLTVAEVTIGQLFLVVAVAKVVNDWTPMSTRKLAAQVARDAERDEARDRARDAERDAARDAARDTERSGTGSSSSAPSSAQPPVPPASTPPSATPPPGGTPPTGTA